jgi:hypothetical protein
MRRKGRVFRRVIESSAGGSGKGGGRKQQLVIYTKLPGRGSTNPRNRKAVKDRRR